MVTNDRRIVDAAYTVRRAWAAFEEAAQRRAAATAAARDMLLNANLTEHAEKRAARADLAAGIGRSAADGLTVQQMVDVCGVPAAGIWRATACRRIESPSPAGDGKPPLWVVSPDRRQVTLH